jgi:hypothetical protein
MKAYITKFALTKGILEVEGEPEGKENFRVSHPAFPWQDVVFKLGEWHTDYDQALARARAIAIRKADQLMREERRLNELFPQNYVTNLNEESK